MTSEGPSSRRQIEDTTAARLAEIVTAAEQAAKGVIDEAEAEARERLADANAEADRIVAERLDRLAGLTEELDLQAEALKRGAEALRAALAEARAELGAGEAGSGSRRVGDLASDPTPERESRPESAPGPRREPTAESRWESTPEPPRAAGPSLTVVGPPEPRRVPTPAAPRDAEPIHSFNGTHDGEADRFESPDSVPESGSTPAGARLLATQMAVSGSSRDEIEQRLRSGFQIADTAAILDAILGPER